VVLNCQNYYFKNYTAGADIIMEDTYPIGINETWSKWNTTCNTTIGDCGCDNCLGGSHAVQDVRDRLDVLARYEQWEGLWPKMKIHNPQSFHGEGYWARDPTPDEEYAMNLLAINHGALSIISWVYPAAEVLTVAHGKLAAVVTRAPAVGFIVGNARPKRALVDASLDIDVAYWEKGSEILVSVVNGGYSMLNRTIEVDIPGIKAGSIKVLWGDAQWSASGSKISTSGYSPLETSLFIVSTGY